MNLLNQPKKLSLIIVSVGFIALFALSHFALHPLYDASLQPQDAADQSRKFSDYFDKATLLIYVVLIFIANLIYRDTQKGIYLLYAWLIFSTLTLFSYMYMSEELFHFKKQNGLWEGESSLAFIAGFFLCLIAATAAFINYAVLKKVMPK
jgi:Kef-type K+ transport system membrane component KefB